MIEERRNFPMTAAYPFDDVEYLLDRCSKLEDFINCSIFNVHVSEERQQEARDLLAEGETQHPPGSEPGGGHRNHPREK